MFHQYSMEGVMAISQSTILGFAAQASTTPMREQVKLARARDGQTAFLCHSHKDVNLAKCVQAFLNYQGWEVYIDWDDASMPDVPNRGTAEIIQEKIRDLMWFLFLATENSMASRWCPWEIGYADGSKKYDSILILPTSNGTTTHGNEYL